MAAVSPRILECLDALPVEPGMRVLEFGSGPGVAARELVRRGCVVHAVDRSATAIAQAVAGSSAELATGRLSFEIAAVEEFELAEGRHPFDLAFALRVGALDGRHPGAGALALPRIRAALVAGGRLFVDGGDPLREVELSTR